MIQTLQSLDSGGLAFMHSLVWFPETYRKTAVYMQCSDDLWNQSAHCNSFWGDRIINVSTTVEAALMPDHLGARWGLHMSQKQATLTHFPAEEFAGVQTPELF